MGQSVCISDVVKISTWQANPICQREHQAHGESSRNLSTQHDISQLDLFTRDLPYLSSSAPPAQARCAADAQIKTDHHFNIHDRESKSYSRIALIGKRLSNRGILQVARVLPQVPPVLVAELKIGRAGRGRRGLPALDSCSAVPIRTIGRGHHHPKSIRYAMAGPLPLPSLYSCLRKVPGGAFRGCGPIFRLYCRSQGAWSERHVCLLVWLPFSLTRLFLPEVIEDLLLHAAFESDSGSSSTKKHSLTDDHIVCLSQWTSRLAGS